MIADSCKWKAVMPKKATALFDYAAQAGDELSFAKGDIILDVDEDKPGGGWCTGRKGARGPCGQ